MLGSWLIYLGAALGTGLLGLFCYRSPHARRILRRARRTIRRKAVGDTKAAWHAHQQARAATARGQLRARRRQQPPRLTFGHRRTPDDPTLTRRTARATVRAARTGVSHAVNRVKLARLNRRARRSTTTTATVVKAWVAKPAPQRRALPPGPSARRYACIAVTQDGTRCANPQILDARTGKPLGHCWIPAHRRQVLTRR